MGDRRFSEYWKEELIAQSLGIVHIGIVKKIIFVDMPKETDWRNSGTNSIGRLCKQRSGEA
jgi:hypothetical protein